MIPNKSLSISCSSVRMYICLTFKKKYTFFRDVCVCMTRNNTSKYIIIIATNLNIVRYAQCMNKRANEIFIIVPSAEEEVKDKQHV